MHNAGEEAMEVKCRLMSGGAVLEEAEIPLEANGQLSWFIEDEFTATDTSDFVGSVRRTAPEEGKFTGLAVEADDGNRIFTTLPVVPVVERMTRQWTTVEYRPPKTGAALTSRLSGLASFRTGMMAA